MLLTVSRNNGMSIYVGDLEQKQNCGHLCKWPSAIYNNINVFILADIVINVVNFAASDKVHSIPTLLQLSVFNKG